MLQYWNVDTSIFDFCNVEHAVDNPRFIIISTAISFESFFILGILR